jgi:hypothetical protein
MRRRHAGAIALSFISVISIGLLPQSKKGNFVGTEIVNYGPLAPFEMKGRVIWEDASIFGMTGKKYGSAPGQKPIDDANWEKLPLLQERVSGLEDDGRRCVGGSIWIRAIGGGPARFSVDRLKSVPANIVSRVGSSGIPPVRSEQYSAQHSICVSQLMRDVFLDQVGANLGASGNILFTCFPQLPVDRVVSLIQKPGTEAGRNEQQSGEASNYYGPIRASSGVIESGGFPLAIR